MKESKLMTISVNQKTIDDLNYLVQKTGMKKSEIIRELLRECVINETLMDIVWNKTAVEATKKVMEKYMPERFTSHNALYINHQNKIREKFKKKSRKDNNPNETTADQDHKQNLPNEKEEMQYPCEGPDGRTCNNWDDYMASFDKYLEEYANGQRI